MTQRRDSTADFLERLAERNAGTAQWWREQIDGAPSPPELERPAPRAPAAPPRFPPAVERRRARARAKVQQRARSRVQALRDRDERYLARLRQRLQARGVELMATNRLKLIPFRVWMLCACVLADRSGRAARLELSKLKNRAAAGAILRASIAPELGAERRSWSDLRTRRIAALGLALVHLADTTRRRDQWGGGMVRGLARKALCALLRDPLDPRPTAIPSVEALVGVHRTGADPNGGQVGYLRALVSAGLVYRQQLPASVAGRDEVGPSGWAMNRYWIVTGALELAAEWAVGAFRALLELASGDAAALASSMRSDRARARAAPA